MRNRIFLIDMPAGKCMPAGRQTRAYFRRWVSELGLPQETPDGFAFYRRSRNGKVERASFAIIAPSLRSAQRIAQEAWQKLNGA